MPLPLGGQPGGHLDLAGRLDQHVAALVRTDAGALDVARQADADLAPLGPGRRPERLEGVPADELLQLLHRRREVAGVVDQRTPVLERQAEVVGHLVGLDEVRLAHGNTIEPQFTRYRIQSPLHDERALWPAGAPVRRHDDRVRVQALELDPVRARLVRAEQLGRRHDRHDQPVRRVGAVVVPERHVQPEQPSLVVEPDLDVMLLGALVRGRDEVLAAVLGELDRLPEGARRHRHEHLLRPGMHDLDAEPAADVRCDDLDVGEVQAQLRGDGCAHAGRGLRRGPQAKPLRLGVPPGQDAPRLERGGRRAFDGQVEREPVLRAGDGCLGVAVLLHHAGADVARHVVMDEVGRRPGRVDAHDGGQRLVGHDDPLGGVLGDVAVTGDDHRDRLAHVVDLVAGERVRGAAVGERRMRDEQRKRLGQRTGQIVVGVDGDQPVDVEGRGDVDVEDPRVRVWRADQGGRQRVVAQVVEVSACPHDEAAVLDPLDRLAEHLGHRDSSAARRTAATMFW